MSEPVFMPPIRGVQRAVAAELGVPLEMLVSGCRRREVVWPRIIAIDLARRVTGASLTDIGHAFRLDRTTVRHALKRAAMLRGLVTAAARLETALRERAAP